MKTQNDKTTLVRAVAPEDLRPGQYIAMLHETIEFVRLCVDPVLERPPKKVRVAFLPDDGAAGVPMKVLAVSLPFVFVKDADGKRRTLDVRRWSFARLPKEYARQVWLELRAQRKRELKKDD